MDIKNAYTGFIENFRIVILFISENFGEKDILLRKNKGLINNRNFEIKNCKIKGYIFHGSGCNFYLKNTSIDVEFDDNIIGFTDWSFYTYSKNINSQITESEVKIYLNERVEKKQLNYTGKIYLIK